MASLLTDALRGARPGCRATPTAQSALLADWHRRKTALYKEMVARGACPARPGIARIVGEALDAGWALAVASTSAEASVRAVLDHVVGADDARRFAAVLRGRRRADARSPHPTSTCSRSRARRRPLTTRS